MSQEIGSYIMSPEERYLGKLTFRGGAMRFTNLTNTWERHGLMDRARGIVFRHFLTVFPAYRFAGKLVHEAFMHRVHSPVDDGFHFRFKGTTVCRFGEVEFGLITGLRFGAIPRVQPDMENIRLIDTYFKDRSSSIKFIMLETAFLKTEVVEDAWRLGLVYFVEGFLHGCDDGSPICMDLLYLVEDLDRFYAFPWGSWTFDKFRQYVLDRDWRHYIGETFPVPYTLSGWAPAFQYWIYETVPYFGRMWAEESVPAEGQAMFPRMLRWRCKHAPQTKLIMHAWSSQLDVVDSLG